MFRVAFTDTLQGRAIGRFAAEELGAETAAVLYDAASAYNRNLATVFGQSFEAAGGRLVASESFTTGETDFRLQLERIRDRRPEVLLLPNYPEDVPMQARQARELGIDANFLGSDAWAALSLAGLAGLTELEGSYFALHWHPGEAATDPEAQRFLEGYRQAFGQDPGDGAALIYDAFGLLFHALGSAGGDPAQIRRALGEIDGYRGLTGRITFRGTGGDPTKRLVFARIQEGESVIFGVIEPGPGELPAG